MNKEIIKLTDLWYRIVSLDHHKDRDCHFYINTVYSYGNKPKFRIGHFGYVGKEFEADFETYEQAEEGMIREINELLAEEKTWAEEVLQNKKGWDKYQIENAEEILKLLNPNPLSCPKCPCHKVEENAEKKCICCCKNKLLSEFETGHKGEVYYYEDICKICRGDETPNKNTEWDINKPMGVSLWARHGKQFGYWSYFRDLIRCEFQSSLEEWAELPFRGIENNEIIEDYRTRMFQYRKDQRDLKAKLNNMQK